MKNRQITDAKLPSKRQVFTVLLYNIREVKLTTNESANLLTEESIIFWEKTRIHTKALPNIIKKLTYFYQIR